ncbi:MAG: acetyl-CoA carboxylase carboxyltransferase subunit alpha [Firmicutes bacterium]|nr:acetyl-CoA carboxylase carboxyltransferase subunit alpha [Bacillota bacterium]
MKTLESIELGGGQIGLAPAERVKLARNPGRPGAADYIDAIFTDFFPMAGDRNCGEDEAIIGGPAFFHGIPVTVMGQRKGRDLEERQRFRFGMPNPEGYRKAERLMKQAEKFRRPVITFVDTPGAYPGKEAEERGQGEAIARCLAVMSRLTVPVISVFIGEGGSGGALAIGVADATIMLENSIFSILSPEGFASILWKDANRWEEASRVMKLTAGDLKELGIADVVVSEAMEDDGSQYYGAHLIPEVMYQRVDEAIRRELKPLLAYKGTALAQRRYEKLRAVGAAAVGKAVGKKETR